jgi:hypothetical protein
VESQISHFYFYHTVRRDSGRYGGGGSWTGSGIGTGAGGDVPSEVSDMCRNWLVKIDAIPNSLERSYMQVRYAAVRYSVRYIYGIVRLSVCLFFFLFLPISYCLSLSLSLSSPNKPLSDWLCVCPPPLLSPTMLFFLSLSSLYPFQSFSAYYSNKSKYSIVYFYCEIFLLQISQISPSKFDRNCHESISARYLYCKSTGTSPVQITPGSWVK